MRLRTLRTGPRTVSADLLLVPVAEGEARVALRGMGAAPVGIDAWRRAGARGRQEAERQRTARVAAYLGDGEPSPEWLAAFAEGFLLAGYRFTRYTSDPERRGRVQSLTLVGEALPRPRELGP